MLKSKAHDTYMQRALELAALGLGNTYPNPVVGAVLVYNNMIIGEGYHHKAGEPHAEINALNSVKNKSLIKHATLYVTLEPCSHVGKTPPCADAIIEHGIKKVVVAMKDPFEKVAGRGITRLQENGVEVVTGVMEEQSMELNLRFITFHVKKRPYIILKWAQTADGFIDKERKPDETS
ncbi:MAG: bifunctional diaminohydroxyphosphoribosylaminopyrimidine deaminase/5-amino-6-(5-phosphoribosylamino)uracil reductase RibD, partial [Bacteroidales bacterium]|nr:bifunctional diaminohydroxyphosphoribosylaminopyrimidine deaminase/5-amino-6-(5-phosphoribosylamino)uracil reductase RibD [Bacteroidales bacterium]